VGLIGLGPKKAPPVNPTQIQLSGLGFFIGLQVKLEAALCAVMHATAHLASADLGASEGALLVGRHLKILRPHSCMSCADAQTHTHTLAPTDLGASEGGPNGRHWVLDPIDGTRGFVSMRQYAVCLGMLQDGQVELGVLGCPNLPQVCVHMLCVCVRVCVCWAGGAEMPYPAPGVC